MWIETGSKDLINTEHVVALRIYRGDTGAAGNGAPVTHLLVAQASGGGTIFLCEGPAEEVEAVRDRLSAHIRIGATHALVSIPTLREQVRHKVATEDAARQVLDAE